MGSACAPSASTVTPSPFAAPRVPPPALTATPVIAADASTDGGGHSADESPVFVENDYEGALAEARARRVPLFIDAWAPWCHTCLSMRNFVFPDPELRRYTPRFVWLALDTERESNAAAVTKLGVHVLPTLYVVEPATEQPVVAWPGSLTTAELEELLDDAEVAANRKDAGGEAMAALLRGRQASATGQHEDAVDRVPSGARRGATPVAEARDGRRWPRHGARR